MIKTRTKNIFYVVVIGAIKLFLVIILITSVWSNPTDILDEREQVAKHYLAENMYSKAIDKYKKNIIYYRSTKQEYKEMLSFFWMARTYDKMGKYKKSLLIYQEILSKFKEKKDVLYFSYIYSNLAVAYRSVACEDACCSNPNKKMLDKSLKYLQKSIAFIEQCNKRIAYEEYHSDLGTKFEQYAITYRRLDDENKSIEYRKKSIEHQKKYINIISDEYNVEDELTDLASTYFDVYGCGNQNSKEAIELYKEFLEYLEKQNTNYNSVKALVYAKLAEKVDSNNEKVSNLILAISEMQLYIKSTTDIGQDKTEAFMEFHESLVSAYADYKDTALIHKSEFPLLMSDFIRLQESKANDYVLAKSYFVMYQFYKEIKNKEKRCFHIKKALERIKVAIKKEKPKREEYSELLDKYSRTLIEEYDADKEEKQILKIAEEYLYFYKKYYWNRTDLKIKSYLSLLHFLRYKKLDKYREKLNINGFKELEKSWHKNIEEKSSLYYQFYDYYPASLETLKNSIDIQKRMNIIDEKLTLASTYYSLAMLYEEKESDIKLIYKAYRDAIKHVKEYIKLHPNEEEVDDDGEENYESLSNLEVYAFGLAQLYLENYKEKEFLALMNSLKKYNMEESYLERNIAYMYEMKDEIKKMFKHLDIAVKNKKYLFFRQEKYFQYAKKKKIKKALSSFIKKAKVKDKNQSFYLGLVSKIYLELENRPLESLNYMVQANKLLNKKYKLNCKHLIQDYEKIDVKLELGYEDECEDEMSCKERDTYSAKLDKLNDALQKVCKVSKFK